MSEIDPSASDAVRRRLDGLHAEFAGLGSGSGLLRGLSPCSGSCLGLQGRCRRWSDRYRIRLPRR